MVRASLYCLEVEGGEQCARIASASFSLDHRKNRLERWVREVSERVMAEIRTAEVSRFALASDACL